MNAMHNLPLRLRQQWNGVAQRLQRLLGDSLLNLLARLAIAAIFLRTRSTNTTY